MITEELKTTIPLELKLVLQIKPNLTVALIDDLVKFKIQKLNLTITSGASSSVKITGSLTFNYKTVEKIITLILKEHNSNINALYTGIIKKKQQSKITTKQDHQKGLTTSNIVIKSVVKDAAKFNCNSLIFVAPKANEVQAFQVNKNLVLNPQAIAISSPKLEVLAHQVKCSHGAAISYLDQNLLFFLQNRGFSKEQAKKLLIKNFIKAV